MSVDHPDPSRVRAVLVAGASRTSCGACERANPRPDPRRSGHRRAVPRVHGGRLRDGSSASTTVAGQPMTAEAAAAGMDAFLATHPARQVRGTVVYDPRRLRHRSRTSGVGPMASYAGALPDRRRVPDDPTPSPFSASPPRRSGRGEAVPKGDGGVGSRGGRDSRAGVGGDSPTATLPEPLAGRLPAAAAGRSDSRRSRAPVVPMPRDIGCDRARTSASGLPRWARSAAAGNRGSDRDGSRASTGVVPPFTTTAVLQRVTRPRPPCISSVRIPLATALVEELVFRAAVILGLGVRDGGDRRRARSPFSLDRRSGSGTSAAALPTRRVSRPAGDAAGDHHVSRTNGP